MINKFLFILGGVIGFFICYLLAGKKEGEAGIFPPLIIHLGNYNIHFHHWMNAAIILIILFSMGYYNSLVHGLLVGVIIQGLTYHDFYQIITTTKYVGLWGITYHIRSHKRTKTIKRKNN